MPRASRSRTLPAFFCFLCLAGCSEKDFHAGRNVPREWLVYKNGRQVLELSNEPGAIISTAMLFPGEKPSCSAFLSARAMDPQEEPRLHAILARSAGFDAFVNGLRAEGYELREQTLWRKKLDIINNFWLDVFRNHVLPVKPPHPRRKALRHSGDR